MNLFSGTLGVVCALSGLIDVAFILMLAAACFDFFDGFAARKLSVYSDIGKELDSLADMVSFGVLPAVMLCVTMMRCLRVAHGFDEIILPADSGTSLQVWIDIASCIPLLIAVFSGLRLAKFNIDERQHGCFIGLPTPASAMICGSIACFAMTSPESWIASLCGTWWFIPALTICLCALLVCEIPMFAMKFGKGMETDYSTKMKRIAFLAGALCIIVAVAVSGTNWSIIVLGVFLYYLLINMIFSAVNTLR